MDEEEIIKRIENAIIYDRDHRIETKYDELPLFRDVLQNLVDLYKAEKEKNKVIEVYRHDMPPECELVVMRKEDFERNYSNEYISKDKIKAKIEEYDEMIEATYKDNTIFGVQRREICLEIKSILQKLLEN